MGEAALRERFVALVHENPVNRELLQRLPELGVEDCWVVAGCLFGTVWNALSDRPLTENIRDYDIFYFDPETSYEAEDAVIRRGEALFGDLEVEIEIRNQARVPLWYEQRFGVPYPPISESRTGIERFVVAGTCCGISSEGEVHAPYGFADMFDGILRWNPMNPTPHQFDYKCETYRARWPWLRVEKEPAATPAS
ncbi:nucleotidyltransferase family protein [Nisaea acidiphila]|uniref:Nucleotidyltransferase family protein n=1 Tax=Nisaea acidiphila TaxID=1862145 RepID=A0A9J7AVW1_9PROT|nr:nucleotidyltransferase family protein [Nisaea acidiphila]UUX51923.1 nucleotidyltransferase family protein [Nisaea acidiphila]